MGSKYIKFFGSRFGCKLNDIKHFKAYLPNEKEIKTVCEPYAGSFALIRKHYKDSDKKLHINDNDQILIETMNYVKKNPKAINKIKDDLNNIVKRDIKIQNKRDEIKEYLKDQKIPETVKSYIYQYFNSRFVKQILCDINEFKKLLDKIEITNKDANEIMDLYKDDKEAFLFFDPPYLDSDNTEYKGYNKKYTDVKSKQLADNTEYMIQLMKYMESAKCKIMLIINSNAITKHLFKNNIKHTYAKIYQCTKNKTDHLIITNY